MVAKVGGKWAESVGLADAKLVYIGRIKQVPLYNTRAIFNMP